MKSGSDDADGKFKTSCEILKRGGGGLLLLFVCFVLLFEEERTEVVGKPSCFYEWESSLEAKHFTCIIIIGRFSEAGLLE